MLLRQVLCSGEDRSVVVCQRPKKADTCTIILILLALSFHRRLRYPGALGPEQLAWMREDGYDLCCAVPCRAAVLAMRCDDSDDGACVVFVAHTGEAHLVYTISPRRDSMPGGHSSSECMLACHAQVKGQSW